MDIRGLFEKGLEDGFFADFDVCVRGTGVNLSYSGGKHISVGARLFDIASLTKACTHLLFLKLFAEGKLSPEDVYRNLVSTREWPGDARTLRHFLCYTVGGYALNYEFLRDCGHGIKDAKKFLISSGFRHWEHKHEYDNLASAFLGILLEKIFGDDLEKVLVKNLPGPVDTERFGFHLVNRGLVSPDLVVPTSTDPSLRGIVHDPFSRRHQAQNLSVAGLFSDAETLTVIFEKVVDELIVSDFYDEAVTDQLKKLGIIGPPYGLGFDMPMPGRFGDLDVKGSLIFTGHTGGRIFFTKENKETGMPRLTLCLLANRVLYHKGPANVEYRNFCWQVINEALKYAQG